MTLFSRTASDTGASVSDGLVRVHYVPLSDAGASVSDATPVRVIARRLVDRGATVVEAVRFTGPRPFTPSAALEAQIETEGTLQNILNDLQPELAEAPEVDSALTALAGELARVDATAHSIIEKMFPQNADDQFLTLPMWESLLGLPIGGSLGASVSQRRDVVVGVARARRVSSGVAWGSILDEILGPGGWSVADGPGPYEITLSASPGSVYTAGQVLSAARLVTPAHIRLLTS